MSDEEKLQYLKDFNSKMNSLTHKEYMTMNNYTKLCRFYSNIQKIHLINKDDIGVIIV